MTDFMDRLRASKEESDSRRFSQGRIYGERWAKEYASYDELKRVVTIRDDEDYSYEVEDCPYSAAELLFFDIDGGEYRDRGSARDFWESNAEDAKDLLQCGEFLHGFAEGAADFFESIEAQI